MKKIILIGFAACYKTTAGKLLADKLNFAFVDTDEQIEKACGMSVQQIFDKHGEPYFRKVENELLLEVNNDIENKQTDTVVACGGGSVLSCNFDRLARDGVVIWLTAKAETVHARLGEVARPLFDGLTVRELNSRMQMRAPIYNKLAQMIVETDGKTPAEIAEQIYNRLLTANVIKA